MNENDVQKESFLIGVKPLQSFWMLLFGEVLQMNSHFVQKCPNWQQISQCLNFEVRSARSLPVRSSPLSYEL